MSASGSPPTPNLQSARQSLNALRAVQNPAKQEVDAYAARLMAEDRSWIAKFMLWIFGILVIATLAGITASPLITPDWKTLAPLLLEVAKTILPVVTLVLGFYFGRSDRR